MFHVRMSRHLILISLMALGAAGCSPSVATVSGKVTLQGKAVTAGNVLFVGPNNQIATGKLDGEGHYTAPRVPLGSFKVAVQSLRPDQVSMKAAQSKTDPVIVPDKYRDVETSGLTCDVKQKQQEYNIDLP